MSVSRRTTVLAVAAILVLLGGAARAAIIDVTQPTDPVILVNGVNDGDSSSGPPPAAESVEHVIDNLGHKHLNFLDLGSGFIVTPQAGPSVVVGLRLYTANDADVRDPASYELAGSNDDPAAPELMGWSTIAGGDLALPLDRNASGQAITLGLWHEEVVFDNSADYTSYRVTFPTLRDAGAANSMQIGEVELLAEAEAPPPPFDLTHPDDPIEAVQGEDDGDGQVATPGGDNPPPNEGAERVIDDEPGTKYLNFLDLNSGVRVTLEHAGGSAISGIALTTANDAPARDPASVTITASNDGENWSPIVSDFATPLPDDRLVEAEFSFEPETPGEFLIYQVIFPTLKDAGANNSMQLGEMRLVPEPATLALMSLAGLALLRRRRR